MSTRPVSTMPALLALLAAAPLQAQTHTSVIDFDAQWPEGTWFLRPVGLFQPDGGNPGGNFRTVSAGAEQFFFSGKDDGHFVRDLTADVRVRVGVDVVAPSLGNSPNGLFVVFINRALAQGELPYTSVHFQLGTVHQSDTWSKYSVTFDPQSATLPAGWGAYGGSGQDLPAGVSFADVMASYDEIGFTNLPPGYFGFTELFDVRFDNLFITRDGDGVFAGDFDPD